MIGLGKAHLLSYLSSKGQKEEGAGCQPKGGEGKTSCLTFNFTVESKASVHLLSSGNLLNNPESWRNIDTLSLSCAGPTQVTTAAVSSRAQQPRHAGKTVLRHASSWTLFAPSSPVFPEPWRGPAVPYCIRCNSESCSVQHSAR